MRLADWFVACVWIVAFTLFVGVVWFEGFGTEAAAPIVVLYCLASSVTWIVEVVCGKPHEINVSMELVQQEEPDEADEWKNN